MSANEFLTELLRKKKTNRTVLAKQIGVAYSTLWRWMKNPWMIPIFYYDRIEKALLLNDVEKEDLRNHFVEGGGRKRATGKPRHKYPVRR